MSEEHKLIKQTSKIIMEQDAELAALRAQIQTLREALNELRANCENRQDEPFIGYVRKTCAAALKETK